MNKAEESFTRFPNNQEVIERLSSVSLELEQDTEDRAQLNPAERLSSISKVWETCRERIGNPTSAIDVGSGFGYGVVFLEGQNIKAVGIENVGKKIEQGQELFRRIGVNITNIGKIDFEQHPAFYEGDINEVVDNGVRVDLITIFYLSLEMVSKPETFQILHRLLEKDGKILLSTEASVEEVKLFLENSPIKDSFNYEILEVPDNFEKTAIILKIR